MSVSNFNFNPFAPNSNSSVSSSILSVSPYSSLESKNMPESDRQKEWHAVHILDKIPYDLNASKKATEAYFLAINKEYDKAQNLCNQLVEEYPGWSRSWLELGNVLWLKSNKENGVDVLKEAKNAYMKAYKICKGDPDIQKGLGKIAYSEKNFLKALEFFKLSNQNILNDDVYFPREPTASEWIRKCEYALSGSESEQSSWIKI